MTIRHHDEVLALLTSLGWAPNDGAAIVSKTYPTAVGPKTAFVYLGDFGPEDDNVMLTGHYLSEGNNILEASCQLLPKNADANTVRELVHQFAARCDKAVAESYAARLLALKD